jgi:hypothetical protein
MELMANTVLARAARACEVLRARGGTLAKTTPRVDAADMVVVMKVPSRQLNLTTLCKKW